MIVASFNDLDKAFQFIEHHSSNEYFKTEILKLPDGRWRVGIITEQQLEMDV